MRFVILCFSFALLIACGDDDGGMDAGGGTDAAMDSGTGADAGRTSTEFCADYEDICMYGGMARFGDSAECVAFFDAADADCRACMEVELAAAETGGLMTHCPHPNVPGNPCGDECF